VLSGCSMLFELGISLTVVLGMMLADGLETLRAAGNLVDCTKFYAQFYARLRI